ncbi:regulatory iron-sulfur-containing complex subunit RicT [Moheibacter stercoris]|uniref:Cell fate regulator YaaT (PSP1 superfamily) n=1 Tax=Moheibacter stercoris TaxID=1628251 RepID=A0ABV2LQ94_9FLAO
MGCGSCGPTSNGLPKGCNNNGACGVDSGCGKLPVFDWLSNMRLPNGQLTFNCVEVRFKNDRKLYYQNTNHLALSIGDVVAVEAQAGHDIGVVTLTGELVRVQMKKRNLTENSEEVRKVYRIANEKDIETWKSFREKEQETMMKARRIAVNLGLEMKISDVEYQGDGMKCIFYYTAEGRVDFRELIKQYASNFGVRIEMKQIGYRQEAAKVGGIGSCGRELCCSTWLTDFRSVNTAAARYQQLSINPQKLAGQCGKLKCCLNYELDSYLDALDEFPSMESTFETEKGTAYCVKIDVFKKEMWFTSSSGGVSWYKFSLDQAKSFIDLSKNGGKTASLEDLAKESIETEKKSFTDVIEENSLERFERKNKNRNKNRKNKPKDSTQKTQPQGNKPNRDNKKPQGNKPNPNKKQSTQGNKEGQPQMKKEGDIQPKKEGQGQPKQGNPNQKPKAKKGPNPNQNPNKQNNKPNSEGNQNPKPTPKPKQQNKPAGDANNNPNSEQNPNPNKQNKPKKFKNRNKRGPQNSKDENQ